LVKLVGEAGCGALLWITAALVSSGSAAGGSEPPMRTVAPEGILGVRRVRRVRSNIPRVVSNYFSLNILDWRVREKVRRAR
jgi:hypothetical protein